MANSEDADKQRKSFLYDRLRMMIDSGLYDKKAVFDTISQETADPGAKFLLAEQPKLRGYAAKRMMAREKEEQSWRDCTPNDRLDAAFKALNASGIVALQNAGWTMTTGWEDCWDAHAERQKKGAAPRGCVFYHTQDLERGVAGQSLLLAFGVFSEKDDGDPEGNARIASEICDVLRAHGLELSWSGSPFARIELAPFVWRKRRITLAPAVPVTPKPEAAAKHPPGE